MGSKLLKYFNGDELAANVWQGKYAQEGEETPDDMHKRLAKEFARIENKYALDIEKKAKHYMSLSDEGQKYYHFAQSTVYDGKSLEKFESRIYNLFKDFKYIIPQGSIMSQLGAKSIGSLSNCFVIGTPEDSYGGIFQKDEQMAQLMKRRGGVGLDISTLRPKDTSVSNAAKTTTGAVSFMHRFSNTTREVAQNGRK
jgi:ribonucleoside-diphosphate reductase alpha chain